MANIQNNSAKAINSNLKKKPEKGESSSIARLGHGELERNLLIYLARKTNDIPRSKLPMGLFCKPEHEILNIGVYREPGGLAKHKGSYRIVTYKPGGLAEELTLNDLIGEIEKRTEVFGDYPETLTAKYCFTAKQCTELAKRMVRRNDFTITEWPQPLGFKSSQGVFLSRRSFDPVMNATPEDFPFINSYLSRVTNNIPLCQLVGSVLEGKPFRKYTSLLHGASGGGKSTFSRILRTSIGEPAVGSFQRILDKYSYTFVVNTTAWFSDETDSKILFSPMYKEISGSDTLAVRMMNKDWVIVKLNGVFFFNMNTDRLELPKDDAVVKNRILPNEVLVTDEWLRQKNTRTDQEIDKLAEVELPFFTGYCLRLFKEVTGKELVYDLCNLGDFCTNNDDRDMATLFEKYYEVIPLWNVPGETEERPQVTVREFIETWEEIAREHPSSCRNKTNHDLRAYIKSLLDIEGDLEKQVKIAGKNIKCIRGIRRCKKHSSI